MKAGTRITGHTAEVMMERASLSASGPRAVEAASSQMLRNQGGAMEQLMTAAVAGHGGVMEVSAATQSVAVGVSLWERMVGRMKSSKLGRILLSPAVLSRMGR